MKIQQHKSKIIEQEIKLGQKWVSNSNINSIGLSRSDIMRIVTVMDGLIEFKPLAGILSRADADPLVRSKSEFLKYYTLVDDVKEVDEDIVW